MRRRLAGVLVLLAGVTAAPAHEIIERLDACAARLDHELDVGYERIAARCPELAGDLAHSTFSAWLPADWNQPHNQLSTQGLEELRTLLSRSLSAAAPQRVPSAHKAAAVLARILQPQDTRRGWWDRFKAWLRALTSRGDHDSDPLGRWLGAIDLSQGAARLLTALALAAVMAIALGILVNELRVAGLLKARVAARGGAAPLGGAAEPDRLRALERLATHEQPALLLELITERLTAQGRLPPARALTTQELLRSARLADDVERGWLSELAVTCEQLRFSTVNIAAASTAAAISAGHRVLARLENAASARTTANPGA